MTYQSFKFPKDWRSLWTKYLFAIREPSQICHFQSLVLVSLACFLLPRHQSWLLTNQDSWIRGNDCFLKPGRIFPKQRSRFSDKYILVKDRWCEKIDFSVETKEHELNSHWLHYVGIHADLWDQWIVHYTWEIKRKKGKIKSRPGKAAQWVRVALFQSIRTWVWIPRVHGKGWAWLCMTYNFSTAGNKDMRVTGACWLLV